MVPVAPKKLTAASTSKDGLQYIVLGENMASALLLCSSWRGQENRKPVL